MAIPNTAASPLRKYAANPGRGSEYMAATTAGVSVNTHPRPAKLPHCCQSVSITVVMAAAARPAPRNLATTVWLMKAPRNGAQTNSLLGQWRADRKRRGWQTRGPQGPLRPARHLPVLRTPGRPPCGGSAVRNPRRAREMHLDL